MKVSVLGVTENVVGLFLLKPFTPKPIQTGLSSLLDSLTNVSPLFNTPYPSYTNSNSIVHVVNAQHSIPTFISTPDPTSLSTYNVSVTRISRVSGGESFSGTFSNSREDFRPYHMTLPYLFLPRRSGWSRSLS